MPKQYSRFITPKSLAYRMHAVFKQCEQNGEERREKRRRVREEEEEGGGGREGETRQIRRLMKMQKPF